MAPKVLKIQTNKSPTAAAMNGLIKPAISPPGEKLVIKKSEIKFGGNSPSNSPPPPCNLLQRKKSP